LVEAHFFVGFAIGGGPVKYPGGVFGFATFILKGKDYRYKRLGGRLPSFRVGISSPHF
jgi:hypothetical protein